MLSKKKLQTIRQSFPFFENSSDNQIIYLDNAATTQKPQRVIDCLTQLWNEGSANVHRSSHSLANKLTNRFEKAREICRVFLNASNSNEIVWTSGTTEAINLVANSWGMDNIKSDDVILISEMEHHANIVPWQQLCQQTGATLKTIPLTASFELDLDALDLLLDKQVKMLAIAHISNVTGVINPIRDIVSKCHQYNCKVLVDGAQAVAHLPIDVQQLDCDFYVFSGHKCFGPEGTGVLYGKEALLNSMPPWKSGGEMVKTVSFSSTTFQKSPLKFEAGTPNISAVITLAEALEFINGLEQTKIQEHERELHQLTVDYLSKIKNITLYSNITNNSSIVAFSVNNCSPLDITALLDEQNIAVRSGFLCAMPLVTKMNPQGVIRVSFCFYNTTDEVLTFIQALKHSIDLLID